jgi:hypothetical protein
MSDAPAENWSENPDVVLFIGRTELPVGATERQSLSGAIGKLFGRSAEEVKVDFGRAFDQMRRFLEGLTPAAHGYEADEVAFQLGFSAGGRVGFIAEAGVMTSVTITFKKVSGGNGG